jgi:hypothetical protein
MDIRLTDVDHCAALVLERVNRYNAEHGIQHDTKHSALQLNLKGMSCSHCGKSNHNSDKCYLLHPELRPKSNNKHINKPIITTKSHIIAKANNINSVDDITKAAKRKMARKAALRAEIEAEMNQKGTHKSNALQTVSKNMLGQLVKLMQRNLNLN